MAVRWTKFGPQSYDPLQAFRSGAAPAPAPAPPPDRPFIQEADIGFFKPRKGDIEFAGPGAAAERAELGQTLARQEQQRQAERARAEAGEEAPDVETLMEQEIGKIVLTGDVEKDKLSYMQAVKSALATAGAGAVGAGGVGLVAGAPAGGVGAIPGAIGGAIIGGVGGFLLGFQKNLKAQRADMLKGEAANLMKQEQNMLKLIMETNKYGNYAVTLPYFTSQMSLVQENYGRLKAETTDELSLWLGEDGHKQLEKYETFYSDGGMRDVLTLQMQNAMSNPDPSKNDMLQVQVDASERELAGLEE